MTNYVCKDLFNFRIEYNNPLYKESAQIAQNNYPKIFRNEKNVVAKNNSYFHVLI